MSRTDVHRPWRVQVEDPYNRPYLIHYGRYNEQVYLLFHTCGCWMCTDSIWRREGNRRRRMKWRATARDLMKTRTEDVDLIEALPDPHNVW